MSYLGSWVELEGLKWCDKITKEEVMEIYFRESRRRRKAGERWEKGNLNDFRWTHKAKEIEGWA